MYEEFIARRLSSLRMKKNVSAREMSLAIGQNSSYINRIENQKTLPSMQVFFYICEYLNISPYDFFYSEIDNPECFNALTEELKSLDDRQLELVLALVREFRHK